MIVLESLPGRESKPRHARRRSGNPKAIKAALDNPLPALSRSRRALANLNLKRRGALGSGCVDFNVEPNMMRVTWIAGVAVVVLAGSAALLPRMIPVPCERKVGEIREKGQVLRFKVPPSRNILYGDDYHLFLASTSKGRRIIAEGQIKDASGRHVASISVPRDAKRNDWLDGEGLDGYVAAWSPPLKAGQFYTIHLSRLEHDEGVSVWVTGFNLE